jgi:hypothetical protein
VLNLNPEGANEPDMFVLGFQEIVPLTAQQIVQTDPEKRLVMFITTIISRALTWR